MDFTVLDKFAQPVANVCTKAWEFPDSYIKNSALSMAVKVAALAAMAGILLIVVPKVIIIPVFITLAATVAFAKRADIQEMLNSLKKPANNEKGIPAEEAPRQEGPAAREQVGAPIQQVGAPSNTTPTT